MANRSPLYPARNDMREIIEWIDAYDLGKHLAAAGLWLSLFVLWKAVKAVYKFNRGDHLTVRVEVQAIAEDLTTYPDSWKLGDYRHLRRGQVGVDSDGWLFGGGERVALNRKEEDLLKRAYHSSRETLAARNSSRAVSALLQELRGAKG